MYSIVYFNHLYISFKKTKYKMKKHIVTCTSFKHKIIAPINSNPNGTYFINLFHR